MNQADLSQLNSIGLSKNVLRALEASGEDIPPLKLFPKSHIVTFKYYRGVIAFLEESYSEVSHTRHIHSMMCLTFGCCLPGRRASD
jgi:COP9 signalosome complex subunit 12